MVTSLHPIYKSKDIITQNKH